MMRKWNWEDNITVTMPRRYWHQVLNALEYQQQRGQAFDGMTDGEPLADWQQKALSDAIDTLVYAWRYGSE
jgi:hypothetical protein